MKPVLFAAYVVLAVGCSRDLTKPEETHPVCPEARATVSPASAVLNKGDRLTLSTTLTCYGRVLWSSSNTSIAAVDSSGTVSAVGLGTATITAASALDPTVKGAALITVNTGGALIPELVITRINDATGPANLSAVKGPIDVFFSWGPTREGQSLAADLIVNGGQDTTVATVDSPTPAPSSWQTSLRWNTAAFPNGSYTIQVRARIKTTGESVTSTRQQITVKNP